MPLDADAIEFADNPENRCPCVLVLDTSSSMTEPGDNPPIKALNEGLRVFKNTLSEDELASKRVEVAVVTYDSKVSVVQDFVTAQDFEPPTLEASGMTLMGSGVLRGLELIEERKQSYRQNGIAFYRPWIFLITDGQPTEDISEAVRAVQAAEYGNGVVFFAVGVENANMERLAEFSAERQPLKLKGLNFAEMFEWLSNSMKAVSSSRPGDQVPLAPPDGWANVRV